MKILIVDDVEANRLILANMLGEIGETDYAENGAEGVMAVEESLLKEDPYDLICLDINMPVMDGLEALHTIREAEKRHCSRRSVIFMVTACSSPDHMLRALENEGCDDFIVKPVMLKTMISVLHKHGLAMSAKTNSGGHAARNSSESIHREYLRRYGLSPVQ